ncbi:hypothetical protein MML48_5g00017279 [Holotrichia oblita]|uniref:Uncharacterized protein n=1 Tax=Holotrichia oblita TaxID=644536 RepID=A0ACB9T2Q8_HOLOL|nr:hypothetical protein MML48_5g00017279 [Holotrichia oblita]
MASINVKKVLQHINKTNFYKPIISMKKLKTDEKYLVLSLKLIKTKFGEVVVVELKDSAVFLPKRFHDSMTPEIIKEMNKLKSLHLVYMGELGAAYNCKFVNDDEESDDEEEEEEDGNKRKKPKLL